MLALDANQTVDSRIAPAIMPTSTIGMPGNFQKQDYSRHLDLEDGTEQASDYDRSRWDPDAAKSGCAPDLAQPVTVMPARLEFSSC